MSSRPGPCSSAWDSDGSGSSSAAIAGSGPSLVALLVAQGFGVVATYPFGLSYYNVLVGGLPGAERLGLEVTYWSDAVDRRAAGPARPRRPTRRYGRARADALPRPGSIDHGFQPTLARREDHPARRGGRDPCGVGRRLASDRVLAAGMAGTAEKAAVDAWSRSARGRASGSPRSGSSPPRRPSIRRPHSPWRRRAEPDHEGLFRSRAAETPLPSSRRTDDS